MARGLRGCLVASLLAVGCGARDDPPARSVGGGAWETSSRERELTSISTGGRARVLTLVEPIAIAAQPPSQAASGARPPLRRRIDLSLRNAPLHDAVRLLAEAGRFAVVVDDELRGEVNLSLKNVEPYEALQALAAVKGADVTYHRQVVIVRLASRGL